MPAARATPPLPLTQPNCRVCRVLAAATYIFCASAIPCLAFGEQLHQETDGALSAVSVLAATAATGVVQAVIGGQPLLIVGVAEPIVLIYGEHQEGWFVDACRRAALAVAAERDTLRVVGCPLLPSLHPRLLQASCISLPRTERVRGGLLRPLGMPGLLDLS